MAVVRLRIESVVAGGAGLAREASGRVVFVDGAIPGETVDAEISEERRDYAKARLVGIAVASPHRLAPPCPFVATGCGGCGWQHIEHHAQLRLKEEIVADGLRRIAGLRDLPPITTATADLGGARTTVRVGISSGRPSFRARSSTELVAVDRCMVSHPRLSAVLSQARFPGATEVLLRVSEATGEVLALVAPPTAARDATVPPGVRMGTAGDGSHIEEEVAGHRFRISGPVFFQSSPGVAAALVETVAAAVGDVAGQRVVDAYGGVGLFAKAVAAAGGAATTVVLESDPVAVADARHNLAGLPAKVIRCEVGRWRPSGADVVIADPARPGLGKPGVRSLGAASASTFVLVSCDAGSMARDARLLARAGYRLTSVVLVDAFPHTPHVEAVSRFVRDAGAIPTDSGD